MGFINAVSLTKVTKRFRDFCAVRDLSFEIKRGAVFGLLGPNGAGKTTTIRMIVNILAPDSGDILILGEHASPKLKRRIGYLPEERGLYKDMKIGDLLVFFAIIKGIEKAEAERRVNEWLGRLQLAEWKDKKAGELSKGMGQKVQFIMAIIHQPELLILDEPFSGLDPISVSLLKNAIFEMKDRSTTIIFSTHQMEQVEQLCDDICLMNRSRMVLGGSLREIKRSFGANIVILDYQGEDSFLKNGLVKSVTRYPAYCEIRMNEGADPHEILTKALAAGARVNRFEIVEPSLNDIFISTVRDAG